MYAIVEIAGQQFKVAKDQKIFVHRLKDKEGSKVSFDKVFLLDDGGKVTVGAPSIIGASVEAKVKSHLKGDKLIVFKKKRRKGYRVKNGHRQSLTELTIEKIVASGSNPVKKSKAENTEMKLSEIKLEKTKKSKTKASEVDYLKMTVAQLKLAAKEKGVEGYTSLKKAELIKVLTN